MLTQWQKDCFLCTYLEDFKRKGGNAQPYMVFTMFQELLFHKGIVLVRGDVLGNSLSKIEANEVWRLLRESYTDETRFEMVHLFNNDPNRFSQ